MPGKRALARDSASARATDLLFIEFRFVWRALSQEVRLTGLSGRVVAERVAWRAGVDGCDLALTRLASAPAMPDTCWG